MVLTLVRGDGSFDRGGDREGYGEAEQSVSLNQPFGRSVGTKRRSNKLRCSVCVGVSERSSV